MGIAAAALGCGVVFVPIIMMAFQCSYLDIKYVNSRGNSDRNSKYDTRQEQFGALDMAGDIDGPLTYTCHPSFTASPTPSTPCRPADASPMPRCDVDEDLIPYPTKIKHDAP